MEKDILHYSMPIIIAMMQKIIHSRIKRNLSLKNKKMKTEAKQAVDTIIHWIIINLLLVLTIKPINSCQVMETDCCRRFQEENKILSSKGRKSLTTFSQTIPKIIG